MFEFLHGLGSAFSDTARSTDLHRTIVEGASRILNAHGGALYLVDRNGAMLIPTFISKGCPPLVSVPAHILQQAAAQLDCARTVTCVCTPYRSAPVRTAATAF